MELTWKKKVRLERERNGQGPTVSLYLNGEGEQEREREILRDSCFLGNLSCCIWRYDWSGKFMCFYFFSFLGFELAIELGGYLNYVGPWKPPLLFFITSLLPPCGLCLLQQKIWIPYYLPIYLKIFEALQLVPHPTFWLLLYFGSYMCYNGQNLLTYKRVSDCPILIPLFL